MDFDETPDEAAFRAEVKAFLDQHVPGLRSNERDQNSIFITDHDKEQAHVQRCRSVRAVHTSSTPSSQTKRTSGLPRPTIST